MLKTTQSDHSLIQARTVINHPAPRATADPPSNINFLSAPNFYSKKVNWEDIRADLSEVEWENMLRDNKSAPEIYNNILEKCLEISKKHVPMRTQNRVKNQSPRDRKIIMRKRST